MVTQLFEKLLYCLHVQREKLKIVHGALLHAQVTRQQEKKIAQKSNFWRLFWALAFVMYHASVAS